MTSQTLVRLAPLPQSSLLKFILKGLEEIVTPPPIPRVERCLKSSILGSAIYEVFCGWYTSKNLGSGSAGYEPVTCIVASFDAWLFADSDVLWAVLVSKIFEQVGRLSSRVSILFVPIVHV